MRCVYCLNELELCEDPPYAKACVSCGLRYASELLATTDMAPIAAPKSTASPVTGVYSVHLD